MFTPNTLKYMGIARKDDIEDNVELAREIKDYMFEVLNLLVPYFAIMDDDAAFADALHMNIKDTLTKHKALQVNLMRRFPNTFDEAYLERVFLNANRYFDSFMGRFEDLQHAYATAKNSQSEAEQHFNLRS